MTGFPSKEGAISAITSATLVSGASLETNNAEGRFDRGTAVTFFVLAVPVDGLVRRLGPTMVKPSSSVISVAACAPFPESISGFVVPAGRRGDASKASRVEGGPDDGIGASRVDLEDDATDDTTDECAVTEAYRGGEDDGSGILSMTFFRSCCTTERRLLLSALRHMISAFSTSSLLDRLSMTRTRPGGGKFPASAVSASSSSVASVVFTSPEGELVPAFVGDRLRLLVQPVHLKVLLPLAM